MNHNNPNMTYGTTIISVRKGGSVVIAGDGQVSLGDTVMKGSAKKVRFIKKDKIMVGFAGATADAFTLMERLENKLEKHSSQLLRSCVELAKDWRTDKYLRQLQAMMIAADRDVSLIVTGNGDVIEPDDGILAIGSGGNYALAAARAMIDSKGISAEKIAKKSLQIAADICVYTNHTITLETLKIK